MKKDKTEIIVDDTLMSTNVKKDAYYLASLDSPHLVLSQVQMKEGNYNEWVKVMCLSFVEGLIPKLSFACQEETQFC